MNDDLIARLRWTGHADEDAAADALEAQARRIAELEEESARRRARIDELIRCVLANADRITDIKDALKLVKINLHNTEYAGILTDLIELIESNAYIEKATKKTFDEIKGEKE